MVSSSMLHSGFHEIYNAETNPSGILRWFCAPDSWGQSSSTSSTREGCDGKWDVQSSCGKLIIYPAAKKDFWQKTYYEPLLIKDDGAILGYPNLQSTRYYTLYTKFDLTAVCQFDQAGLCVRFNTEHWIKTGIEVVDRVPRLSCVVTNRGYSDWSTQSWPSFTTQQDGNAVLVEGIEIRVHCRGSSFVVEARMNDGKWEFFRIAHLDNTTEDKFLAGVFACCPIDQHGGHATFHHFQVQEGSHVEHNANDV